MRANRPKIIGLTGGIATGKSTASRILTSLGARCIDADAISHRLTGPGGAAVDAVCATFGEEMRGVDGGVDRGRLGEVVFHDEAARRALEGIIHPMVQRITLEQIDRAGADGEPLVVLDVPLLFESGMDTLCDETWVVTSDEKTQLQRLMARDGLDEADARARMASQMPLAEKARRATVALDNDHSEERLRAELTILYHNRLRAARRENA